MKELESGMYQKKRKANKIEKSYSFKRETN